MGWGPNGPRIRILRSISHKNPILTPIFSENSLFYTRIQLLEILFKKMTYKLKQAVKNSIFTFETSNSGNLIFSTPSIDGQRKKKISGTHHGSKSCVRVKLPIYRIFSLFAPLLKDDKGRIAKQANHRKILPYTDLF